MTFPTPCNCVVQTVDVDGAPPVIEQSTNNSVIQSVNVNTGKGKLSEWFLVSVLTVFLATILLLGFFVVSKSSVKSYLSFVQGTIQSFEPTNPPVIVTNTVSITNKLAEPQFISPTNLAIFGIKWRVISAPDGKFVQLSYGLNNQSTNDITNIKLGVKINEDFKSYLEVETNREPALILPMRSKLSVMFIDVTSSNMVTNLLMRVEQAQVKP